MKIDCFAAALFIVALAASPSFAQTRPTTPAPGTATPSTAAAAVPESKVALINTELFSDDKQGILRIVSAQKRVDGEFQPRRTELQQLQQKLTQLNDDITKQQAAPNIVDQKALQAKIESLEQLKRDGQRKQEDAQAAYNKRMQEVLMPIYDDLGKALDAFAKARGITLMLDASKIGPAILSASDGMDVTRAFIAEFNSKYPATASVTPPQ
jgi:outer membrane protein